MKRLFFIFIFSIFFSLQSVNAQNIKVIAEMETDFSTITPTENVSFRLIEEYKFPNDVIWEKNCIIKCRVTKVTNPKHFLRSAWFSFDPISYTIPSKNNEEIIINNPNLHGKSLGYNNMDAAKIMEYGAATIADFVFPGISIVPGVMNGIIYAEDDDNKIINAIKTAYNESFLGLINKGEHLELYVNDFIYLKFWEYEDDNDDKLSAEQQTVKDKLDLINDDF